MKIPRAAGIVAVVSFAVLVGLLGTARSRDTDESHDPGPSDRRSQPPSYLCRAVDLSIGGCERTRVRGLRLRRVRPESLVGRRALELQQFLSRLFIPEHG